MKYVKALFLVYLFLKPYYLFSSGGLQIGDLLLVAAFALYLVITKFNKKTAKEFFATIRENRLFLIFTGLTFVINSLYFLYYGMQKFIMSSLYYVFIFFAIALFSVFGKDKRFLSAVNTIIKINLLAQIAISMLHIGREYGSDRYMGTFNDPNQFGFYVLISYLLLCTINIVLGKKQWYSLPFFAISLYLIFLSASTGSLLGLAVFTVLQVAFNVKDILHPSYKKIRIIMASILVVFIAYVGAVIAINPTGSGRISSVVDRFAQDQTITNRIASKISKADNEADVTIWEDRGYDIIYKYPQYIPFGAGEGNYDRYTKVIHNYGLEIHATLPSMLFYYGIIPFIIILGWFYRNIKNVDKRILIIYTALLAESFILLNQRQSLFWILFVLGGLYASNQELTKKRMKSA